MLRSIGKTCFACAYTWGGASRLLARTRRGPALPFIAGYHRVVENFERCSRTVIPSMLISKGMLERHLDWIAKRFTVVPLDELGASLERSMRTGKQVAALTFDDGYSDVYYHAYPLLKKKGIPAAVFVVSGLIGKRRPPIFDRFYAVMRAMQERGLPLVRMLADALRTTGVDADRIDLLSAFERDPFRLMTLALNAFPQQQTDEALDWLERRVPMPSHELDEIVPLTWEMLRTMQRDDLTIGSHTASHCLLPSESLETTRTELLSSKQNLESNLGVRVNHFAYPDGRFNPGIVRAVKAAGYQFGYTICRYRDPTFPLLTIPRKVLWERSSVNVFRRFSHSIMTCHIDGVFDRHDRCEHDHQGADLSPRWVWDGTPAPAKDRHGTIA